MSRFKKGDYAIYRADAEKFGTPIKGLGRIQSTFYMLECSGYSLQPIEPPSAVTGFLRDRELSEETLLFFFEDDLLGPFTTLSKARKALMAEEL